MLSLALQVLENESIVLAEQNLHVLAKGSFLYNCRNQCKTTVTPYFQVNAAAEQLYWEAAGPVR